MKSTPLIGIVDGIPDVRCKIFEKEDIEVESAMVPEGLNVPDRHGTEVCSLIFKNYGNDQTNGKIRGLSLPIFFPDGNGNLPGAASQVDIARALTIAVERGAAIVNVSAGQKTSTAEGGRHLEDALALCQKRRILVVAAAGNDGCACLHVPAAVPTALAVGAMNDKGEPLDASNWGEGYSRNGVLAPGVDLEVVGPNDEVARRTGTSYAAAVVSGVAARLLSTALDADYGLDPIDIRSILLESADPCIPATSEDCSKALAGRLNIEAAFSRLHEEGRRRVTPSDIEESGLKALNNRENNQMDGIAGPLENSAPMDVGGSVAGVEPLGDTGPTQGPEVTFAENNNSSTIGADHMQISNQSVLDGAQPAVSQSACSCEDKKEDETTQSAVEQSACGGDGSPPQIAYALGTLWFDFGSEARYDAIVQAMGDSVAANTPSELFGFLSENLEYASGITFILMQDQIPLYAIQPAGPFALKIFEAMLDGLKASLDDPGAMNRVAIPGLSSGTTRLMNGMVLPMIYPDLRGMAQWKAPDLIKAAKLAAKVEDMDEDPIFNFLVRVYDELRNLGMSPEERAINFAATNAYQAATAFGDALARNMELFGIQVSKSPICRPDSDCWDVQLQMFDPENERRAGRIYRYTVDVSETLPVTVGPMRAWSAPLSGM